MDMSNNPTAAILALFYGLLLKELLAVAFVAVFMFLLRRRHQDRVISHVMEDEVPGRRLLRGAFGGLWILDGLLQAQPAMSSEFVPHYLVPILNGQPIGIANLMERGIIVWAGHPIFWDTMTVWAQIFLGLMILVGRDTRLGRVGLWASIGWSLIVWVMGEGLGGLFVPGNNTWLTGTPGSVVFYGIAAWLLLVSPNRWRIGSIQKRMRWIVGGLWLGLAMLQAWPGNGFWSARVLAGPTINMAEMAQPSWVSAPLYAAGNILLRYPHAMNGILTIVMAVLGIGWLWKGGRQIAIASMLWAFITWWLGQDFGVLGGLGTDPNSGLPMIFVMSASIMVSNAPQKLKNPTGKDLEMGAVSMTDGTG